MRESYSLLNPARWMTALGCAVLVSTASAQCPEEPLLANTTGAGLVTCPCFAAGEEAGVFLEAPASHYPIEILRIGVGWGSQQGGAFQTVEDALHIYEGASLPNIGGPTFSAFAPQMTDGFINEFDVTSGVGDRIIDSGPFLVTLKFFNANVNMLTAPSVVHDNQGCIPGKNVIKAVPFSGGVPAGWYDACTLGVSGNWIFHVVYRRVNCGPGSIGDNYCMTNANSTGATAEMRAFGSLTASDNNVMLEAISLPQNSIGFFITSLTQDLILNPGGSQGNLCLTGNIGRYSSFAMSSGSAGMISLQIDTTSMPTFGNPPIFAGQSYNFQAWFRDANPNVTSNFSDGLEITFN